MNVASGSVAGSLEADVAAILGLSADAPAAPRRLWSARPRWGSPLVLPVAYLGMVGAMGAIAFSIHRWAYQVPPSALEATDREVAKIAPQQPEAPPGVDAPRVSARVTTAPSPPAVGRSPQRDPKSEGTPRRSDAPVPTVGPAQSASAEAGEAATRAAPSAAAASEGKPEPSPRPAIAAPPSAAPVRLAERAAAAKDQPEPSLPVQAPGPATPVATTKPAPDRSAAIEALRALRRQ